MIDETMETPQAGYRPDSRRVKLARLRRMTDAEIERTAPPELPNLPYVPRGSAWI